MKGLGNAVTKAIGSSRVSIFLKLLLALPILDAMLTFQNRWPTVGVRWVPELSIELAALLLILALAAARWDLTNRVLRNALIGGYLVFILGRYVDVTVPLCGCHRARLDGTVH